MNSTIHIQESFAGAKAPAGEGSVLTAEQIDDLNALQDATAEEMRGENRKLSKAEREEMKARADSLMELHRECREERDRRGAVATQNCAAVLFQKIKGKLRGKQSYRFLSRAARHAHNRLQRERGK